MRPVTRRFGVRGHPPRPTCAAIRRVGPALAVFAIAALLAGKSGAQPQDGLAGEAPAQDGQESWIVDAAAGTEGDDVRDALSREIERLRADIAGIERLMRWQADLARIARTDRAEALRQRLPMSDCRASALAPLCDELTGLFRREDGDGNALAAEHENERDDTE